MNLSTRVQRIKPSPTLAVSARANQMKAAGHNIINLGVGEPDFDTPDFIKEAAIKAICDGFTKYTAVDGIAGLKKAIINKFNTENHLQYEPGQIIVSCGTKQAIYNLTEAILNAGDEVIIPAPYWVSYPDMVLLADATPVIVSTSFEQHFKMLPEQLEAAITPNTRLLILNSPSNPSGITYSKAELQKLAEILLKHPQILIASDDMYEHILWTKEPYHNIVNVCPELYDRTIVFNGVSKAYAMKGWRIGYGAGSKDIITAMVNIQSQSTSNPTSISQIAAQAALEGNQQCVQDMTKAYKERHEFIFNGLKSIPGIAVHPSDGTFYTFPDVKGVIDRLPGIENDLEFSEYLLKDAGIAVVPGTAFGCSGCIRLSFATSLDTLKEAINRLHKLLVQ
jgi:aspartate aminotransferase